MKKSYFYGSQVSEYGIEKGFVDYRAFASSFDAVLNNNILHDLQMACYEFDFTNLYLENEDDENDGDEYEREREIYQWYIVPSIPLVFDLLDEAGECYAYCEQLDLLLWGVDHWGTSWDYVLTSIPVKNVLEV